MPRPVNCGNLTEEFKVVWQPGFPPDQLVLWMQPNTTMPLPHSARSRCWQVLPQLLREKRANVIADYLRVTREEIPAARSLDDSELVDCLPMVLDEIALLLSKGTPVTATGALARKHGSTRALNSDYEIADLVTEYRVLNRVLFQHLRTDGRMERICEDLLIEAMLLSMAKAATEFTSVRSGIEQKYRQEHAFLETVIAEVPVAVSISEAPTGRALYYNAELERMLGRPVSQRKDYREFEEYGAIFPDGSKYRAEDYPSVRAILKGESTRNEEMHCTRPDGTASELVVNSVPIRDENGVIRAAVTTAHDITRLKNVEKELKESIVALEQERDLREHFISALWHDLRTPLTAARISAQMIAKNPDVSEAHRRLSSRIIDNMDRMDRMIRDLLDAARIRAGTRLAVKSDYCEIGSTVRNVLNDLATVHGDRFVFEMDERARGYWDCQALVRIVENLCSNAVKYGARNAPITVRCKEDRGSVLLSVHNEGTPIPVSEQSRIFESFQRAHGAEQSGKNGWGIGLALVRALTESQGGAVSVESQEGRGTTFTVKLPCHSTRELKVS